MCMLPAATTRRAEESSFVTVFVLCCVQHALNSVLCRFNDELSMKVFVWIDEGL